MFRVNVFGIFGFTFEFNIGGVAITIGCVSEDLSATVGQLNTVTASFQSLFWESLELTYEVTIPRV